jgi:hypothetical protein
MLRARVAEVTGGPPARSVSRAIIASAWSALVNRLVIQNFRGYI